MTWEAFRAKVPVPLNGQQEAAVRAVDGPVLLLAVPGSGKTTVLILRLGYLLFCQNIPPERILTMTYTVAATRDMAARFAAYFGEEMAGRLEFRTINGVSARIIRYYEQVKGRRAFALITDEGKLSALVGELCRKATGEFATESTIKFLRTAITYIKNMQLTREEIEELRSDDLPVARVYRDYCTALRQNGWMDYDDQMVYAAQILRQYPEILKQFQAHYPYLCVDEAQDTSKIQHAIIRLLAGESPNLFMVGDEDQSIYGFRAAYPAALMAFERVYPGAKVLLMEKNYRSTATIVAAAGKFIRQNGNRREKTMTASHGEGPAIRELWAYDRADQYKYLARLAAHCDRETAVLYRNNDSALPVLDLLDRQGIGYRCRQVEGSFFSHRVVRDVLDFVAFAHDPTDGEIFARIYYKFRAGIPKAAVETVIREGGELLPRLAELSGLSPWTQMQCKSLSTHFAHMLDEGADKAIYRIRHFMGYGDYLEERGGDLGKLDILEALGKQEPNLDGLVLRLEALQTLVQEGSTDRSSNFILSTIHSSKGLEYQRVILMDVADGILPSVEAPTENSPREEVEAYEEERRLFYVGMTRAKEELGVFRFKKVGLTSAFATKLFPKKPVPVREKSKPLPKPAYRVEVIIDAAPYIPGVRVVHQQFGSGKIVNKLGDVATILFDNGEEKRFSLATALRQKQLKQEKS